MTSLAKKQDVRATIDPLQAAFDAQASRLTVRLGRVMAAGVALMILEMSLVALVRCPH